MRVPSSVLVTTPLVALTAGFTRISGPTAQDVAYPLLSLGILAVAFVGYRRSGPQHPPGWLFVLIGFAGWAVGDLGYLVEQQVFHLDLYPAPSDVVYLGAYGFVAVGLVRIVRRRGVRNDLPALLDAAILAVGTAVVAGVFVITPVAVDSSLSVTGKLVSSAYPVADVLLLGILVQLWSTRGSRTLAFCLLTASLAMNLAGDVLYTATSIVGGETDSALANDVIWLTSYLLICGAAWSQSVTDLAEPLPGREELSNPKARLVVLTGGLVLPGLTLAGDGLDGGSVSWLVIAAGSVILSVLVLTRMAGLLAVVRAQATQLSAQARLDPLTGVANRRSLDFELSRACRTASEQGSPLSVAMVDLDHFKAYNDAHGHPAGDLLLKQAVAAWSELLAPGQVLARYGGEEFVVLLPGLSAQQARPQVLSLLGATPQGQTFSAGVATWDVLSESGSVLAAADVALYEAKRAGRNRVRIAGEQHVSEIEPPHMLFQPIVDLDTLETIGVEALSRFVGQTPAAAFRQARLDGTWAELEAAAIRAARADRPAGLALAVNVSLDALDTAPVRDALTGDLSGITLEISHGTDSETSPEGVAALELCRRRGARLAIDDWGRGYSHLDRILRLRPDVVKIDVSMVASLDLDYQRAAVRTLAAWAEEVGVQVCAEGVESDQQRRLLGGLGVHLGQGHLFGEPAESLDVRQSWVDLPVRAV